MEVVQCANPYCKTIIVAKLSSSYLVMGLVLPFLSLVTSSGGSMNITTGAGSERKISLLLGL